MRRFARFSNHTNGTTWYELDGSGGGWMVCTDTFFHGLGTHTPTLSDDGTDAYNSRRDDFDEDEVPDHVWARIAEIALIGRK